MPVTFTAAAYPYLKETDLQRSFDDCVSLSFTNPQSMAGSLDLTSLTASISLQTQQLMVTGDAVFSSTSAIAMPVGTTLERPNVPQFGHIRANKDAGTIEVYLQAGKWATVQTTAAATTPVNPPVTMNGPSFGQVTSNAIPLAWVAPTGGTPPYTYSVQYRLAGTSNWSVWAQQMTATSTTVTGLLPAARYEFLLTAYNASGNAAAPVAATNTLGYLAGGPSNLVASTPTSTSVTLTWLAVSSSSPISYQVQYAMQGSSSWTSFGDPTMDTSMTVTGLSANSTYNFQVVAKTTGSSMESFVTQMATTAAATVAPNTASNLVFTNITTSSATVSWTPPSSGTQPLVYQVQYQQTGSATWSNYKSATVSTSVTMQNLNSGSAYNVRIVSTNSAGTANSNSASFTTTSATATVGNVAGTQNSGVSYPVIVGPQSINVANGSALPVVGITVTDPQACYASGTLSLTVSCGSGQLTMTDQNSNQINGSGTNKISVNTTYAGVQQALASLVYTATKTGADAIGITLSDQLIQKSTLSINATVSAASGSTNPSPPPGGGTPASITQTGQPTDGTGPSAYRVRDCLDGFGLNVRLEDVGYNSNYTLSQAAFIENLINYLGNGHIKYLREVSGINLNQTWLAQVAQNCNAKYVLPIDWIVAPSYYQTVLNIMANFATNYPSYVFGLEGAYGAEINNNLASAAQFQPTLYNEAHALGLPAFQMSPSNDTMYNPSQFGTPPADLATVVAAPWFDPNGATLDTVGSTGSNGYLYSSVQDAKVPTPNVPVSISWFGWSSFPDNVISPPINTGWVSQSVQAAYVLETIFSAFRFGAKYYFYAELLDVAQGLSSEDFGDQYGLFDINGNPKTAAVAIHNIYQLLYDTSTSATTFTPGKLNYTVSGKPAGFSGFTYTGYQDLLFQKSNGDYWLVMWNEQQLNTVGGNNVPLTVSPTTVTLTFNSGAKSQVNVYDPLSNTGTIPVQTKNTVSSLSISLPAYPILVQIVN